jgi:hypothetical protein
MDLSSSTLTIGLALEHAQQRGARVDVATGSGRIFVRVTVAALDRFCIVLLDDDLDGQAHVVSRDAVTSVSMDREALLAIDADRVASSADRDGDPFVFGPAGAV